MHPTARLSCAIGRGGGGRIRSAVEDDPHGQRQRTGHPFGQRPHLQRPGGWAGELAQPGEHLTALLRQREQPMEGHPEEGGRVARSVPTEHEPPAADTGGRRDPQQEIAQLGGAEVIGQYDGVAADLRRCQPGDSGGYRRVEQVHEAAPEGGSRFSDGDDSKLHRGATSQGEGGGLPHTLGRGSQRCIAARPRTAERGHLPTMRPPPTPAQGPELPRPLRHRTASRGYRHSARTSSSWSVYMGEAARSSARSG